MTEHGPSNSADRPHDPRLRPIDGAQPVKPWEPGERELAFEARILKVYQQPFANPTHPERSGTFTVLDSADWVNCVAVTRDDRMLMVEQYRYGTDSVTLETVAGMVEPGEDPMDTCRREVLEETGFASDEPVVRLGAVDANPAILNNRCHYGLLRGVERVREPSLDTHEQIRPVLVDAADIPALIREGRISHSLAVCAFHFYWDYVRRGG